jgi:hypothetical protein
MPHVIETPTVILEPVHSCLLSLLATLLLDERLENGLLQLMSAPSHTGVTFAGRAFDEE